MFPSVFVCVCVLSFQKVLQDFVGHILTQISALLPVDYVKQVIADPPHFSSRSTPGDFTGKATARSVSESPTVEGGVVLSQDGDDDDDVTTTKRESVELYVHRALKMTACCTSLIDILSDPLLIHICMQVSVDLVEGA